LIRVSLQTLEVSAEPTALTAPEDARQIAVG